MYDDVVKNFKGWNWKISQLTVKHILLFHGEQKCILCNSNSAPKPTQTQP